MRSLRIVVILGTFMSLLGVGMPSYAQEAKGPKQFNLAILTEHNVSFVLPSAIILDERGSVGMITLSITNHSKKDQGFAIDKFRVKEVLKPGETKMVQLSATDLDGIGTDQSVFPYYNQLDKAHIGGLLYVKR